MHTARTSTTAGKIRSTAVSAMPEVLETLLSALVGCGIVLMLAFFLSLESWVVAALG